MKISLKDWYYIEKDHPTKKIFRCLYTYTLEKIPRGYVRTIKMRWPIYIFAFIPLNLRNIFFAMWDGGLREFEFQRRTFLHIYTYEKNIDLYKRAEEIFKKKIDKKRKS